MSNFKIEGAAFQRAVSRRLSFCCNAPSKLARSSPGRGLIDLLLRAWTSTDSLKISWIWCARSASKGDQQPSCPCSPINAPVLEGRELAPPLAGMVTALGVRSREKRMCYERIGKRPLVKSLEESEHPRSLSPYEADGGPSCNLRGCRALSLRSPLGDGETQCSKVRSDNVSDGPSLRSQAAIGLCSLSIT